MPARIAAIVVVFGACGRVAFDDTPADGPSMADDPAVCVADFTAGSRGIYLTKRDGSLWTWGNDEYAQLGGGGASGFAAVPQRVPGLADVVQATGGTTACALTTSGALSCWGRNHQGQVGDGTTTDRDAPIAINLSDVAEVRPGGWFTCARQRGGDVYCWGYGAAGRLASGSMANRLMPTRVAALSGTVALANGGVAGCAATGGARLFCWGENRTGAIGDGTLNDALLPVEVALPGAVVEMSTESNTIGLEGYPHVCARLTDGAVYCWGYNAAGQVGDGTTLQRRSPVRVAGLPAAIEIATGGSFSCARTADEHVWCWGDNTHGELGNGTTTPSATPIEIPGLAEVVQLEAGSYHACARTRRAGILCWGGNDVGQLGTGDTVDHLTPTITLLACP